mmetsp:Transcript_8736/g.24094  ORF Transcript_8736/g.24094 Transcript_8736/m.24094 type:complete len:454 (-) Transcript_8736:200-1561(-)|eukprot:CAMPEP_0185186360 /NCGR_PEP_ID=MMETSP1140-20130426/3982_1 /TAXON_ID=298111 /ORGANISM="Pavlova sp., Strain CCMP459" /LENGTH=453 /DNA_ID=CAMNT_0027752647 /DNA_START=74 /DNA_END=1435 /DNA_ORIENTATION=-
MGDGDGDYVAELRKHLASMHGKLVINGLRATRVEANLASIPGGHLYERFADEIESHATEGIIELVWHGTLEANIDSICASGLDERKRGSENGQAHGKGEYYARNPSTAVDYAQRALWRAQRTSADGMREPAFNVQGVRIIAFAILIDPADDFETNGVLVGKEAKRSLPLAVVTLKEDNMAHVALNIDESEERAALRAATARLDALGDGSACGSRALFAAVEGVRQASERLLSRFVSPLPQSPWPIASSPAVSWPQQHRFNPMAPVGAVSGLPMGSLQRPPLSVVLQPPPVLHITLRSINNEDGGGPSSNSNAPRTRVTVVNGTRPDPPNLRGVGYGGGSGGRDDRVETRKRLSVDADSRNAHTVLNLLRAYDIDAASEAYLKDPDVQEKRAPAWAAEVGHALDSILARGKAKSNTDVPIIDKALLIELFPGAFEAVNTVRLCTPPPTSRARLP